MFGLWLKPLLSRPCCFIAANNYPASNVLSVLFFPPPPPSFVFLIATNWVLFPVTFCFALRLPLHVSAVFLPFHSSCLVFHPSRDPEQYLLLQTPLMFTEQMQQDVIMVLKFPSNSPVTHVAANTQPGLTSAAIITVTANRLFAVNKWHGLTGEGLVHAYILIYSSSLF